MSDNFITIFVAGDSTVQNCKKDYAPQAGWAQMLPLLLKPGIRVENHAIGGRSTKSFIQEGRLDEILHKIKEGDYLVIQFGHNDEKLEGAYADPHGMYKAYLKMFIDGAREKGAIPVLITPVNRRRFDINDKFYETHGDYPAAVISLGKELDVVVIDLCALSRVFFEKLGVQESKKIFLFLEPGKYPNYPEGSKDNTHFSEEGAFEIAKLVASGMKAVNLPASGYLLVDPPKFAGSAGD